MLKVLVLTLSLGIVFSCSSDRKPERMLFDFESDAELDRFHWKCHTLFSISDREVTHGSGSLRIEFYPSTYPGWSPELKLKDWSRYKELRFDIFNPEESELSLTVRIDDLEDNPDYADRYNHRIALKPGMNEIGLSLNNLDTSGAHRKLNLKKISRFLLFMVNPSQKRVLYLDNVRLEK